MPNDMPAKREAWTVYTDNLHRDGRITDRQADHWTNPFWSRERTKRLPWNEIEYDERFEDALSLDLLASGVVVNGQRGTSDAPRRARDAWRALRKWAKAHSADRALLDELARFERDVR